MLPNLLRLTLAQVRPPVHIGGPPADAGMLQALILRIIGFSVAFAFMVLTIMLVYAGFKLVTSGGEPKNIQAARNIITYAVVGIVMLVMAWLVLLLIQNLTGVCVTRFSIGFTAPC